VKRLGEPPYLCLITEGKADPANFRSEKPGILETIRDAIADGVTLIQIREKSLTARQLFELSTAAVEVRANAEAYIVVNGRADIAIAAGADGLHLPGDGIPAQIVRRVFPDLVIGASTHSFESASAAAASGADYIFFGPVFATPGKPQPVGPDELQAVCRKLGRFPVIALGGIDESNCDLVLSSGAAGIAAIRSLNEPDARRRVIRAIR
jgi:thiamine-phosphate pyrophosphorylase